MLTDIASKSMVSISFDKLDILYPKLTPTTGLICLEYFKPYPFQIKAKDFNFVQKEASKQRNEAGFRVDYVSVCNSKTLEIAAVDDVESTVLGDMYSNSARLIDNI